MKMYVIYFIIVFGVTACGSRKTDTDISKQSSKVEQTERTSDKTKEQGGSVSETKQEEKSDITNTETTKKTTTEFGLDGKPIKTTTEEITRNRTDKSTKTKYVRDSVYFNVNRDVVRYATVKETITIKEKQKKTSTNNLMLYAGLVIVFGFIAWLGYRYFKK